MTTTKNISLVGELITETCESFRQLHSITRHHQVEKMLEDYLRARQNNYNNHNKKKTFYMLKTTSEQLQQQQNSHSRRHNFAHAGSFRKSIHEVMSEVRR
jgi:hypothetical protein